MSLVSRTIAHAQTNTYVVIDCEGQISSTLWSRTPLEEQFNFVYHKFAFADCILPVSKTSYIYVLHNMYVKVNRMQV